MNNKEIEEQEYLDNGINEKEEFGKFIKVFDPPNFVFWHFEIVYVEEDEKEVGKWERMK